jgi:hypothetical protein
MDYRQFRADHGIAVKDVVDVVREVCPKFSKGTMSFADQPDKYGLCLLPSLDKLLVERFGGQVKEAPAKAQPKRTKPNRFVVYLPDDLAEKVKKIRAAQGCTTQELLIDLIENWLITTEEE